jgi:hypothetical protein
VTTRVEAGENAGKALVEHFAVRRFVAEPVTPARSGPRTLSVPVALEADWDARRCGLAVFLQDETTGRVSQAESMRWEARAARGETGEVANIETGDGHCCTGIPGRV